MPEQPTTLLKDMIQRVLNSGVSYRDLESRAVDPETGETASRAIFHDTVSGKLKRMPFDYHLRAVAAALNVPYERVRQAAIAQWLPAESERQRQTTSREQEKIEELEALANRLLREVSSMRRQTGQDPGDERQSA